MERELFDELSGSIRGGFVVFRKVLAKAFVVQYLWPNHVNKNWFNFSMEWGLRSTYVKIMRAHKLVESLLRVFDELLHFAVYLEN